MRRPAARRLRATRFEEVVDEHSTPDLDQETDVIVIGYGFAGAAEAITAHDAGPEVLLLEKTPEQHKGGNSRVSANLVFWPDDVAKAKLYFEALAVPYMDNISPEMIQVWAEEMYANKAWLEQLGMTPSKSLTSSFPRRLARTAFVFCSTGKGRWAESDFGTLSKLRSPKGRSTFGMRPPRSAS